jgi:hypothetical protein
MEATDHEAQTNFQKKTQQHQVRLARARRNPDRPARCQTSATLKSFINHKAREIKKSSPTRVNDSQTVVL